MFATLVVVHPLLQFRLESNLRILSLVISRAENLCVVVFRLSLSSNLPPAFTSLINLFYFIQLRGKINYYLFISPIFNNLLTCLSIDFYDHLVIALPKGFVFVFIFIH